MERTDYKFYIDDVQMYPNNFGECSFVQKREDNRIFAREEFNGELIFMNEDYDVFKTDYDTGDECKEYELTIERKCDGEYVVRYLGYFALNMGKFDFERCKYSVTPLTRDKYDLFIKNIDVKVNIAAYSAWVSIKHVFTGESVTTTYSRCMYLQSVIKNMLNKLCWNYSPPAVPIVSSFFRDAVNPVTGEANQLTLLVIAVKSDMIYPDGFTEPSNSATKAEITFGEMMDILFNMFQVKWDVDENDALVLKHVSEITAAEGLDLTSATYSGTTSYNKVIEWDLDNIFRYEKWEFADSGNADFRGLPIEYNESCSNKTKVYDVLKITTDIDFVRENPNSVSKDGFVILVTDSANNIQSVEEGFISGTSYPNVHLSTANLHQYYWRHNRIFPTGKLNDNDTDFITTQKHKKLKELEIILCCDEEFNLMDSVTTELGEGEVTESIFYPLGSRLKLKINV